jgi:pimeloyl-ACP methyl ester carboxylesterase
MFAREVMGRVLLRLMGPFDRLPAARPGPDGGDVPILIVGEPGGRSHLWFLATWLRRHGHPRVATLAAGDPDAALPRRADNVSAAIQALLRDTRSERVDVVGFSIGGLAAAWALRHGEAAQSVRRFVSIGVPWQGTRLAVFGGPRIPYSILYGAPLLDDLVPAGVAVTAIGADDDPVVVPASSATPPGSTRVVVPDGGHHALLLSGRVFRAVADALDAP